LGGAPVSVDFGAGGVEPVSGVSAFRTGAGLGVGVKGSGVGAGAGGLVFAAESAVLFGLIW
jgi:hypothetical protein